MSLGGSETEGDLISVMDVARHHGKHKQSVFKVLKRLGIEPSMRRAESSKNQLVAFVTQDEFRRISDELVVTFSITDSENGNVEDDGFVSAEIGVFYLVQLEPVLEPNRFKVGFASNMSDRLRALRCSAPFAAVLRTWRCRRLWEKTAIECVSVGCERLHTEVFRATSIDSVVVKCEQFFELMPTL